MNRPQVALVRQGEHKAGNFVVGVYTLIHHCHSAGMCQCALLVHAELCRLVSCMLLEPCWLRALVRDSQDSVGYRPQETNTELRQE